MGRVHDFGTTPVRICPVDLCVTALRIGRKRTPVHRSAEWYRPLFCKFSMCN